MPWADAEHRNAATHGGDNVMKRFLIPHVICPTCLPKEHALDVSATKNAGDDIISGELYCAACKKRYPIKDGIASLLPDQGSGSSGAQQRYDDDELASRYLWSHFAELMEYPDCCAAHSRWATELRDNSACALDAGCAVGRLTFEMAAKNSWAVGCDLSRSFVGFARRFAQERQVSFALPQEGHLRERFTVELPARLPTHNVEFIVANAQALPFARSTFQQVSSLNLLDRVSYPLAHLYEMNRVARTADASFLCADPFSWNSAYTPEERWLGGTLAGNYAGSGFANVRMLLEGKDGVLTPPWHIAASGIVSWALRTHRNHRELISSHYLQAVR